MGKTEYEEEHKSKNTQGEVRCVSVDDNRCIAVTTWWWPVWVDVALC